MKERSRARERELNALEIEFRSLLLSCVQEAANGRWGLFGQNDRLPDSQWLSWPEAARLQEVAREIKSLRSGFGAPNKVCERFLYLCSLRGSNIPGEPKLAREFIAELRQDLAALPRESKR
jgi:hypothetical protein